MNVVVIGAGPGGEAAARQAAQLGAQVTLVEQAELGGVCLNRGCIPSKAWLSYAKKWADTRAILGDDCPDSATKIWTQMRAHKDSVIQTLQTQLAQSLKALKVQVVQAKAQFHSPQSLLLTDRQGQERCLEFDRAILACGSQIFLPPPLEAWRDQLLTSDRIFHLQELPTSVIIVGGGAIGCEFACLLNAMGAQVTIVEMQSQLVPGEDAQVMAALRRSFESRGIKILTNNHVESLEQTAQGWDVTVAGAKLQAQHVLACVGRRPAFGALGLDRAQINVAARRVEVNAHLQTSNPNVYAVGDVNGLSLFAHAASVQGEIASHHALGGRQTYDGALVPRCLYTWPEVASVGLFLHEAKAQNLDVKAQRFFFAASGKALAQDESQGFVQLVSQTQSGKLLGAQMVGPHVTELLQIVSLALSQNLTRDQIKNVMFAHPTLSEVILSAVKK